MFPDAAVGVVLGAGTKEELVTRPGWHVTVTNRWIASSSVLNTSHPLALCVRMSEGRLTSAWAHVPQSGACCEAQQSGLELHCPSWSYHIRGLVIR